MTAREGFKDDNFNRGEYMEKTKRFNVVDFGWRGDFLTKVIRREDGKVIYENECWDNALEYATLLEEVLDKKENK